MLYLFCTLTFLLLLSAGEKAAHWQRLGHHCVAGWRHSIPPQHHQLSTGLCRFIFPCNLSLCTLSLSVSHLFSPASLVWLCHTRSSPLTSLFSLSPFSLILSLHSLSIDSRGVPREARAQRRRPLLSPRPPCSRFSRGRPRVRPTHSHRRSLQTQRRIPRAVLHKT